MTADHFRTDANLLCDLFLGESSTPPKLDKPRVELGSTWTRHPSPLTVGFLAGILWGVSRKLVAGFYGLSASLWL